MKETGKGVFLLISAPRLSPNTPSFLPFCLWSSHVRASTGASPSQNNSSGEHWAWAWTQTGSFDIFMISKHKTLTPVLQVK